MLWITHNYVSTLNSEVHKTKIVDKDHGSSLFSKIIITAEVES